MMDLKKILSSKDKVLGSNKTLAALRRGELKLVLAASNCHKIEQIKELAAVSGTEVSILKDTNDKLGAMCKKPFAVSVIGFLK